MKRIITLITGTVLLSGLLFTSCIENEESDGVKALRMAQASYIQALADHESAIISADSIYQSALAAIEQATADKTVATTELEIEIMEAVQQSKLDQAVADAEADLAASQISLEQALRDLEAEIAESDAATPALDEYVTYYKEAIVEVESLRSQIVDKEAEINAAEIAITYSGASDYLINSLAEAQEDLEKEQDWQEKYEAANDDPSSIYSDLNAAEVAYDGLLADQTDLQSEIDDAADASNAAADLVQDALDDYQEAQDWVDMAEDFTSTEGYYAEIDGDILEDVMDEPGTGDAYYYSLVDYDDMIEAQGEVVSSLQEQRTYFQNQLSAVTALYNAYATSLDAAQTARDAALAAYNDAVQAYNVALLAAQDTDPLSDATSDATVVAANNAMSDALTDYNDADDDLTTIKSDIAAAAVGFGVEDSEESEYDWSSNFYNWVGNNDTEIEDLIELLSDVTIPSIQDLIDDETADLEELEADRDVVVAVIAYYEDLLGSDTDAAIAALKDAYFDAKDVYFAALDAEEVLSDEMSDLTEEIAYALAVKDAFDDDYTRISSRLELFDTTIANLTAEIESLQEQIDNADITDVEYLQGQLEVLALELEHLEEELTVEETKADNYLALINVELSGE
jgi:DNA repair exonuclease SbcCD ATPase subunit